MSMVAKILIVLNLILAVMVMGAAGAYLQSAENWKVQYENQKTTLSGEIKELGGRLQQTQASLDEANRKATAAESARSAAESANRTLSENNNLNQKKLADYNATLQAMEAKMGNLQANLEAARQENATLQGEKKQADDEKRAALAAKGAAETEQKRLENEVANLGSMLNASQKSGAEVAAQLEAANTTIDMYKGKFGSIGLVGAPVKGQVLAADAKMDIYLISVGTKDGLKMADELTIYRNDQFVAVVVVDKVFDDKASVVVKRMNGKPLKKADIQQGDKVASVF